MPIETDERLAALLVEGGITAVTFDTNIFDEKRGRLNSPTFRAVAALRDVPFAVLMPDTVRREILGHLTKSIEGALRNANKAIGGALGAFDTRAPTRDDLLARITAGKAPPDAASAQLGDFLLESGCEVLDDTSLVDTETLFAAYFERRPPFSHGKKSEFPDALALYALEAAAVRRGGGILVVSQDGDWRAFCEASRHLFVVPKAEKALSLINNAPLQLRHAARAWLDDAERGREELRFHFSTAVAKWDVDVWAHPVTGDVEVFAWAPVLNAVAWPEQAEVDIIAFEGREDGSFEVVVSFPVMLELEISIELDFSVWDGVDRESVSMGSRTIETEREENVRVSATLLVHPLRDGEEEEDREVELLGAEFDASSMRVDLGTVDFFEPEEYSDD